MAKTKSQSVRSRAAKRASSPSIDTDKSLKNIKPPVESANHRPSVLAIHHGAGVSKKNKNGRKAVLSKKQKVRQERALDRAEAVMDKKEKSIEKSKVKGRSVQERAKDWQDHNKRIEALRAAQAAVDKENEEEGWVDEDEETVPTPTDAVGDVQMEGNAANEVTPAKAADSIEEEIEEEIL